MGVEDVTEMTLRIKSRMAAFQGKFDAWQTANVQELETLKQTQELAIGEGEDKITELMERSQELQEEVARTKQDAKVARHEVQAMRDGLATLSAKASVMPGKVDELQTTLQAESDQLEQATQKCAKMEEEQSRAVEDKTMALEYYAQRLGLDMLNNDNGLGMVYTAVNPADPDAKHTLCVAVNEENRYVVQECNPPLPDIDAMVATLIETNDFGVFVQHARAGFRHLYR
jgi:kinetochore protein Spc25